MKKHKTMKIKETNHSAGETKTQEQSLEKKLIRPSTCSFLSVHLSLQLSMILSSCLTLGMKSFFLLNQPR